MCARTTLDGSLRRRACLRAACCVFVCLVVAVVWMLVWLVRLSRSTAHPRFTRPSYVERCCGFARASRHDYVSEIDAQLKHTVQWAARQDNEFIITYLLASPT